VGDQASGRGEADDGAEVRYVVGCPPPIDPDKHEVRTNVRYVRGNAWLRARAAEYAAIVRRLTGSESVRVWTVQGSDGRTGDVYSVMDSEAMARLAERVRELEKREHSRFR